MARMKRRCECVLLLSMSSNNNYPHQITLLFNLQANNVSRFRVAVRLYGELTLTGVFGNLPENVKSLTGLLSGIINCDKENHIYVQVLITFSRHCGEDFAGIVSRKQRVLFEKYNIVNYPRCEVIPVEAQKMIHKAVQEYYASLAKHLVRAHKDLQNRDRHNRHTLMVSTIGMLLYVVCMVLHVMACMLPMHIECMLPMMYRLCSACVLWHVYCPCYMHVCCPCC